MPSIASLHFPSELLSFHEHFSIPLLVVFRIRKAGRGGLKFTVSKDSLGCLPKLWVSLFPIACSIGLVRRELNEGTCGLDSIGLKVGGDLGGDVLWDLGGDLLGLRAIKEFLFNPGPEGCLIKKVFI